MRRRSVRVFVLLVTVAVTAVAVWYATTTEQARGRARLAEQQADARAADAVFALADLRAALHAYVAPGQGIAFWSARAAEQLGRIRTLLTALDEPAAAARFPLETARKTLDRLAAAEARARAHVGNGQMLLAGDVIYSEIGDLLDEVASEVSGARQALARGVSAREAGTANAQSLLAGGVLSVWIVALMLLVPLPRAPAPTAPSAQAPAIERPLTLGGPDRLGPDPPAAEPPSSPAPLPAALPAPDLSSLAVLCADIGRVADATQLDPLLARAASLMRARGLMLWLAEPDGDALTAAAVHGYDPGVIDRLGRIARDADNLTAAAFRSGQPALADAQPTRPAAVAVPLLAAAGPSGVLAAELRGGIDHDLGQAAALAGIVAAQLASLFPPPEVQPEARPAPAKA